VQERLECDRCGTKDDSVAPRELRTMTVPLCDICDASLRGTLGPQPSRIIVLAFLIAMAVFVVGSAVVIALLL
jgi:NAD-dependent SIR2 family protein deacetylase